MKLLLRSFILLLIIAFAAACDSKKDDEVTPLDFTGTWRLIEYNSGQSGENYPTAETLGYEEYYVLSKDSTFRKFRSTGAEATGTYTVEKIDEKYYAVLEYAESKKEGDDRLPITAYGNRTHLSLEATDTLHDNLLATDIGLFIYKRQKEGSK